LIVGESVGKEPGALVPCVFVLDGEFDGTLLGKLLPDGKLDGSELGSSLTVGN